MIRAVLRSRRLPSQVDNFGCPTIRQSLPLLTSKTRQYRQCADEECSVRLANRRIRTGSHYPVFRRTAFLFGCDRAPLRGQQPESLRLCRRIVTQVYDNRSRFWLRIGAARLS